MSVQMFIGMFGRKSISNEGDALNLISGGQRDFFYCLDANLAPDHLQASTHSIVMPFKLCHQPPWQLTLKSNLLRNR